MAFRKSYVDKRTLLFKKKKKLQSKRQLGVEDKVISLLIKEELSMFLLTVTFSVYWKYRQRCKIEQNLRATKTRLYKREGMQKSDSC